MRINLERINYLPDNFPAMAKPKINVFISYAHADKKYFDIFRKGLNSHLFTSSAYDFGLWEDSKIHLGSFWDAEIQNNLGSAGVAILCVSANFLNSKYIAASEFNTLVKKFPGTLIVPVYFNHCNINAWDDLSQRQFFKPSGDDYDEAGNPDFAFCDLVHFQRTDGTWIPDANIDRYLQNLTTDIERALTQLNPGAVSQTIPVSAVLPLGRHDKNRPFRGNKEKSISNDKIVNTIIIAFMILSGLVIFYNLLFNDLDAGAIFKSSLGCFMFFGSLAAFIFNRKKASV